MTPHQLTKRIVDLQHDIDLMGSNHTNSMIRIKLEEARLYVHLIEEAARIVSIKGLCL